MASDADRLWRDTLRLTRESGDDLVVDLITQQLELKAPWTTKLCGAAGVLYHRFGHPTGVTIYASPKVGEAIWAVAGAGMVGPVLVDWGAPVAGLAAAERTAQFAGDSKAFTHYQGGWIGVAQSIAVPLIRDGQGLAVVEVRSHEASKFEIGEAELIGQVAFVLSQGWPVRQ